MSATGWAQAVGAAGGRGAADDVGDPDPQMIWALAAIAWLAVATLDDRVRQLEMQVHISAVAPALAAAGQSPAPNPVAQACADLARRAADQIKTESHAQEEEIRSLLRDLGCLTPSHP